MNAEVLCRLQEFVLVNGFFVNCFEASRLYLWRAVTWHRLRTDRVFHVRAHTL